jgi:hypothetical protein
MLRQTSACGGCGLDHLFVGQRNDLLGQHPQQLAVHVVIVLAIAGRAAGVPDCGVPCNTLWYRHEHGLDLRVGFKPFLKAA